MNNDTRPGFNDQVQKAMARNADGLASIYSAPPPQPLLPQLMTPTPDSAAQGGYARDDDMIPVPRGLLGSACACVRKFRGADSKTYRQLSALAMSDAPPAQQAVVDDALREALQTIADGGPVPGQGVTFKQWCRTIARTALRPSTDAAAQPTDAGERP